MIVADMCLVAVSFFFAYSLRQFIHEDMYPLNDYLILLPALVILWGATLFFLGIYRSFRTKRSLELLAIIVKAAALSFFIFGSSIYFLKISFVSRTFIIFVFALTGCVLSIQKVLLLLFFRYIRKIGLNFRNILIVGTNPRAQRFMDMISTHGEWGLKVLGVIDDEDAKQGALVSGYRVIGRLSDIPDIIHNNVVDEVAFVVPRSWLNRIEEQIDFLETEGIKTHIAVDYFDLKFSKAHQSNLNGFPLLTFDSAPENLWHLLSKRIFDILFSGAMLLALSPLLALIALLIKLTSEGSVFFKQTRLGLNGRLFTLYKFRTMVKDAEEKLEGLKSRNEMKGPAFKLAHDPRLTPVGRFLRKSSLDELPQLWNIFEGDMSLIGPRPAIPEEVKLYDNWHRRRLSMRPGLTGLWQVSGRSKITDFNEWMRLDLAYIDSWSLWLDAKIFFKTIPVVLIGSGAK
jgi:exopolysaccharide biosynthesis polyprenyl glycosylphosphotransferase